MIAQTELRALVKKTTQACKVSFWAESYKQALQTQIREKLKWEAKSDLKNLCQLPPSQFKQSREAFPHL